MDGIEKVIFAIARHEDGRLLFNFKEEEFINLTEEQIKSLVVITESLNNIVDRLKK